MLADSPATRTTTGQGAPCPQIAMTLPQKPSRKAAHNFVVCNMRPSSVRSFNRHAECWYLLLRLALFAVLPAAVSSPANAITYYVSPDGSDKATGTSPQKPWKTIGKVNATALRPGDIVLFKGQATFSGKIYLSPGINGTNGMPITLGSYNPSSGAALSAGAPSTQRATISGGSGGALFGYNNGGLEVRALNFVGSGATKNNADGIAFYNDLPGNIVRPHIYLNGVEASGFGRWGIAIGGYNNRSGYADIRVTNAASHDNRQGGLVVYGPPFDAVQRNYVNTSVYIASVKAYNNVGDPAATTNTGNGIVLGSVSGAMIERCVAHDNGINNKASAEGPVGIWAFDSTSVTIQHNESYRNRTASSADGDGFDLDNNVSNSVLQYNYSHDNDGAGFLVYAASQKPNRQNLVRYNISQNDCRKLGYGAIMVAGDVRAVDIINNTVFLSEPSTNSDPAAIRIANISALPKDIRIRNNIFITQSNANRVRLINSVQDSTYVFQRNNYFNAAGAVRITWGATTYLSATIADWLASTTQERLGGTIVALSEDPLLTNAGGGVAFDNAALLERLDAYKLRAGSSMSNAGLDLKTLFGTDTGSFDFYSGPVPRELRFDIGAHEK